MTPKSRATVRTVSFLRLAVISASLLSTSLRADYPHGPLVDARLFDIAGVRIGMSYQEAVDALVENYGVSTDSMHVVLDQNAKGSGEKKVPSSLKLESDSRGGLDVGLPEKGWRIYIRFAQVPPLTAEDSVEVVNIEYEMAWTEENKLSLHEAAVEKYGTATVDTYGQQFQWCDKLSPHWANCESEAVMMFSGTTLTLSDALPYRLIREAQEKESSTKARI